MLGKAQQELERAINLGPRPGIAFQAHGTLGMVFCELGDYQRAKEELETSASLATAQYIKELKIWEWLEYVCRKLGLQAEARRYAQLANPS
jgi:tetratricopeptide (TPR) repeat protein